MSKGEPAVSCLGTSALLFDAPGATTLENQQRIWALARAAEAWPEVREAVPGVNNLLVTFAAPPRRVEALAARLREGWADAVATPLDGRVVYPVYALGSHPGYCYLGGMDPRIATPRRKVPVISIPGGAVSIGGLQTGVSASDGPSGWNTIGTTEMRFFDATRDPPALLRPGDSIVFRVREIRR
jgi:allophanate hydrolase subunit 1